MHGEILTAIDGQAFIDTPAHRAMVNYDILTVHCTKSVTFVLVYMTIATTETQKAKNNIVRIYREGVISNTNAITGQQPRLQLQAVKRAPHRLLQSVLQ